MDVPKDIIIPQTRTVEKATKNQRDGGNQAPPQMGQICGPPRIFNIGKVNHLVIDQRDKRIS